MPASIFDRSRMSLISASRCLPAAWIFCRSATVSSLPSSSASSMQHLAVADDGVHRRAQLVAHVGEEGALRRLAASAASRASPRATFVSARAPVCCRITRAIRAASKMKRDGDQRAHDEQVPPRRHELAFGAFAQLAPELLGRVAQTALRRVDRDEGPVDLLVERPALGPELLTARGGLVEPPLAGNDRLVRRVVDEALAEERHLEGSQGGRVDGHGFALAGIELLDLAPQTRERRGQAVVLEVRELVGFGLARELLRQECQVRDLAVDGGHP